MHSKIIPLLLLAAATVCHGGSESGGISETTGTLTLRQALALALTRSPELAAVGYDIRIAEARILQAKLLPNPELDLESEDIGGSGSFANARRSQTTLQLGQLIELGGKRRARIGEARLGRDLAAFDYETKKREVFVKTAGNFIDVLAGQRRVEVAEDLAKLASSYIPAVAKRVEAGKASDLEKTRFDVAIGSAQIELEQSKRDLLGARQRLASQWGSSRARFGSVGGDLDATPPVAPLQDLSRRLDTNPRLARFGTEIARREATLAREKAAAVPDVTLRAAGRRIAESDDTTAVLGFSVPLPLWNRNQGNIHAAREHVDRTGAEQAAVAASLMTELSDAHNNLIRARTTISILRESVLPGAESAVKASGEGYEAGRFSFLEVLDARRTLGAARIQYLDAIADYHKALHQVEALTAEPKPHNLP
jgi:outer membrane protein, heavy metal efflux system